MERSAERVWNKILSIYLSIYLCQRLHAAVLVGVSLAHGQVSTISLNVLCYIIYVLHEFCTLYLFNVAGHWAQ